MKALKIILAALLILTTIAVAHAVPVTIDRVELDDIELNLAESNIVSIERGFEYEVEVTFTVDENATLDNAEVEAAIKGYEYNDLDSVSDTTSVFDADAGVRYVKRLKVKFPDDMDEDAYKLRITITDRNHEETVQTYNLKIDVPRHALLIDDLLLNPGKTVKAGSALLAAVRVENKGEKDEQDVKISLQIPELNLEGATYINEIKNDDTQETEDIYIRIPRGTKPGTYEAIVEVEYDSKHRRELAKFNIDVLADETYTQQETGSKINIEVGTELQEVMPESTAVFPLTITNTGSTNEAVTISPAALDWAEVTITPTSTMIVEKGETKTVMLNVKTNKDTPQGAHAFTTTINIGEETEEVTLTAKVLKKESSSLKGVLEITLAVLVILLILLGIGIGISKIRESKKPEYY